MLRKGVGVHDLIINVLSLLVGFATVEEVGGLGKSSKYRQSHHRLVLDTSDRFLGVYPCQIVIVDLCIQAKIT